MELFEQEAATLHVQPFPEKHGKGLSDETYMCDPHGGYSDIFIHT